MMDEAEDTKGRIIPFKRAEEEKAPPLGADVQLTLMLTALGFLAKCDIPPEVMEYLKAHYQARLDHHLGIGIDSPSHTIAMPLSSGNHAADMEEIEVWVDDRLYLFKAADTDKKGVFAALGEAYKDTRKLLESTMAISARVCGECDEQFDRATAQLRSAKQLLPGFCHKHDTLHRHREAVEEMIVAELFALIPNPQEVEYWTRG